MKTALKILVVYLLASAAFFMYELHTKIPGTVDRLLEKNDFPYTAHDVSIPFQILLSNHEEVQVFVKHKEQDKVTSLRIDLKVSDSFLTSMFGGGSYQISAKDNLYEKLW